MGRKTRVLGVALFAGLSAMAGASACRTPPSAPADANGAELHYDPDTRRLDRVTYDRNGDGRIDATTFMDGAVVTRAELDENFDGTIDRREYFRTGAAPGTAPQAAPATVLERVESSTRPDGRITRWERYEGGVLRHVEEDTTGTGHIDKWETWENGSLSVVAMDTKGQGRPDRRLVYSSEGAEPRLEIDQDGSGRFAPPAARR
jgi:hypothetical protein